MDGTAGGISAGRIVKGQPMRRVAGATARTLAGFGILVPVLVAFAVVAGVLVGTAPERDAWAARDNDDAMRLVQVRDWLGGQAWGDLDQHRLGPGPSHEPTERASEAGRIDAPAPGGGTRMHWSRAVDVPITGVIVAARALGANDPERVAVTLAPLAALLAFLLASALAARAAARIAMAPAPDLAVGPALILAGAFALVASRFQPYAIDHHNWQLVLLVGTLAALLSALAHDREGRCSALPAVVAGALASLMLPIGMETAPALAAMVAALAVVWALAKPSDRTHPLAVFAATAAATTPLLLMVFVPLARRSVAACDAFGPWHASAVAVGAGTLALAGWFLRGSGRGVRLAALALAGCLALLAAGPLIGACLEGPYAFDDPRIRSLWLDHVVEAAPLFDLAASGKAWLRFAAVPLIGALAALWLAVRAGAHGWIVAAPCLAATALVLWQVRMAPFATALAIVPLAVAIAGLRARRDTLVAQLGGMGLLLFGLAPLWTIGEAVARGDLAKAEGVGASTVACTAEAALAPLAGLEAGLVAAPSNLGARILLHTRHRTLAAPYHRNVAGLSASFDVFATDLATAEAALRRLGVRYVALCPGSGETAILARPAPTGLVAALEEGRVPDFLRPISDDGVLTILAVAPAVARAPR